MYLFPDIWNLGRFSVLKKFPGALRGVQKPLKCNWFGPILPNTLYSAKAGHSTHLNSEILFAGVLYGQDSVSHDKCKEK